MTNPMLMNGSILFDEFIMCNTQSLSKTLSVRLDKQNFKCKLYIDMIIKFEQTFINRN